jgi:hypothetical protein
VTVYFSDMIVLFHTCFIVTRVFFRVISEFTFGKSQKIREKQEGSLIFRLTDNIMIGEAKFEPGEGILFFPPVYVQRYTVVKNILEDERWHGKIRKVGFWLLIIINFDSSDVIYCSPFSRWRL